MRATKRWLTKVGRSLGRRWRETRDVGAVTVEYAMATIAAAAIAGILIKLAASPELRTMLLTILKKALQLGG